MTSLCLLPQQSIQTNPINELTRLIGPADTIRGKVRMKNSIHGFTDYKLLSVKQCMLCFIQTLPRLLCAGPLISVNFLDLFGPIAGVTNPIMQSLLRRIVIMSIHVFRLPWKTRVVFSARLFT